MPYWNFEYTKAVISTVENVGGGIGQDPATEVTHVRLNQPPVFSSAVTVYVLTPSMTSPGSHPNPMHADSIHTICMNIYNQNYDVHSYVN